MVKAIVDEQVGSHGLNLIPDFQVGDNICVPNHLEGLV